jgi:hypothetical protein
MSTASFNGIERNAFDYARAYAETQSSNSIIVSELQQAYILIAKNLNISVYDFIQILESKIGTERAIYLAAQLNSVRPRNSLLGVLSTNNTPLFISREIAA